MTIAKYSLDVPAAVIGKNGLATATGWITTYNSDTSTREYTGARKDYIQSGVGLSAGAYLDIPMLPNASDQAIRRTADGNAWEIVPDYRGQTVYSTDTGEPTTFEEIGELPPTLTLLAPQSTFDKWNGKGWVLDETAQHAAQMQEVAKEKARLMSEATAVITPLQDAVDTGIAMEEEISQLTAWKTYRALLSRVDVSDAPDIKWPELPDVA
ncbi:tail fiber assembly protein [Serratia rhizosphaerae]